MFGPSWYITWAELVLGQVSIGPSWFWAELTRHHIAGPIRLYSQNSFTKFDDLDVNLLRNQKFIHFCGENQLIWNFHNFTDMILWVSLPATALTQCQCAWVWLIRDYPGRMYQMNEDLY